MRIRKARQILKSLSDDTRLRILNLLGNAELNVTEICCIIGRKQSSVSKHLTRLRLTGMVNDRRRGMNVFYYLPDMDDRAQKRLISSITEGLSGLEVFRSDLARLKEIKKVRKKR